MAVLLLTALTGCTGDTLLKSPVHATMPPESMSMSLLPPAQAEDNKHAPQAPAAAAHMPASDSGRAGSTPAAHAAAAEDGRAGFSLAALKRKVDAVFEPDRPSPAQRQQLGDALAQKVLANVQLTEDAALRQRIERIVHKLARAARQESAFPARWFVHVIESGRADAFTSGGGHLFITRGMIELLGNDERIATVLAHEMAHNLLAHVWDAKEKKDLARRAHAFSRQVLAEKMRMPWLGKSVSFLVNTSLNTYSRQQEYDGDALGLHLLVQAGWRPQAALETFDYLRRHFREKSGAKNFFYGRHPVYDRRRWYLANRIKAHYRQQAGLPPVKRSNWKKGR